MAAGPADAADANDARAKAEPQDMISKRSENIRKYAGDDPEEAMAEVREALQGIGDQRGAPAEQSSMLELYKLRDLLAEEKRLRTAAEAAPRIAEERLLEAEERAAQAEAKQRHAEEEKHNAILECRKDRRAAAEEAERARTEADDKMRQAEDMVAAANKERDERIAKALAEAEQKIAEIRANALEVAREDVKDELEEARTESATAEASIDDIRTELESMQRSYAAKLQAAQLAEQALSREAKALHGRISAMENETAIKVQEARATESNRAKHEISELKDRAVVAEAKARRAGSAMEKAERKAERLKEKVQMLENAEPSDPMERLSRSPPRHRPPPGPKMRSAATEKRVVRQTEEVKALTRELNQRDQDFKELRTEFLNRERDIRLGAADQVDHWMQAAKSAQAHIAELNTAITAAAMHFDATGMELPREVEALFRARSPSSPRSPKRVLKSVSFSKLPPPMDDDPLLAALEEPTPEPSFDPEEMRAVFASEQRLGVVNREIPEKAVARQVVEPPGDSPPIPPSPPSSPPIPAGKQPAMSGRLPPKPSPSPEQKRTVKQYGARPTGSGSSSPSRIRPASAFSPGPSPKSQGRVPRPVVRSRPESASSASVKSAAQSSSSPYSRDPLQSSDSGRRVSYSPTRQQYSGARSQASSPGSSQLDRPFSLRRLLAETTGQSPSSGNRPVSAMSPTAGGSNVAQKKSRSASTTGATPRNGRSTVQQQGGLMRTQSARQRGERGHPSSSRQRATSTSRARPG